MTLSQKPENTGWHTFMQLCTSAQDINILSALFEIFLTNSEKADINTRCLIIKALLKKNKNQREIAKHLKVSIAKITRGSKALKRLNQASIEYLEKNLLTLDE